MTDEEYVADLARQNLTAPQINRISGISLARIRTMLRKQGIEPVKGSRDPWQYKREYAGCLSEDRFSRPPKQKPDPTRAAKEAFIDAYVMAGKPARLVITDDGFRLDGKPIGYNALIRKTNEMRVAWGIEQVTGNPAWAAEENG